MYTLHTCQIPPTFFLVNLEKISLTLTFKTYLTLYYNNITIFKIKK